MNEGTLVRVVSPLGIYAGKIRIQDARGLLRLYDACKILTNQKGAGEVEITFLVMKDDVNIVGSMVFERILTDDPWFAQYVKAISNIEIVPPSTLKNLHKKGNNGEGKIR